MENIKLLYELINDDSNKIYLDNIITQKNNKKLMQQMVSNEKAPKKENLRNEINNKQLKKYRRLSSSKSEINNDELCFDEEDIDSFDTQSTKKKIKRLRKKVKSIDEKIINKLYTPFLEKTIYLRKLNQNIPEIKQMTSSSSKTNYELRKMINDVDAISYQMKIYNNPNLDPNKLSKYTYDSLVKVMVNNNSITKNNQKTFKKKANKGI
jgi:hypothetical protein